MKRKTKLYLLGKLRRNGTSNPSKKSHRLSALVEELILSGNLQYAIFSYICSYLNKTSLEKEIGSISNADNHLEKMKKLKKKFANERISNKK